MLHQAPTPGMARVRCLRAITWAALAAAHSGVLAQERLSDRLLKQPLIDDQDPFAMAWMAGGDVPLQAARKAALLQRLRPIAPELASTLDTLPVTGRVPLPETDPWRLKLLPATDPVIARGDQLLLPARSRQVGVMHANGLLCQVEHLPAQPVAAYLNACGQRPDRDEAWLIQPDGRIQHVGVSAWNAQQQWAVAPGAWIWAPPRATPLTEADNEAIAQLLATQGATPGAAERLLLERRRIEAPEAGPRDLPYSTNQWGVTGLLETPTARLGLSGDMAFTIGRVRGYRNITLQLQPFDWLSGAFRYTDVEFKAYGPMAFSGDQSYKDKSVDLKLRLWKESRWLPQVSLGWRDLLGTGLFSSEYLVGSKRHGDLDFSLGLAWGYLGNRANVRNPLTLVSSRFETRPSWQGGSGGTFNPKAYFRGNTALFGGVQYHTPWAPLTLKLEYDGNDYRHEPFGATLTTRSPLNVGAVWRVAPWLNLTLAYERGQSVAFTLSTLSTLDGMHAPKLLDPPTVPVAAKRRELPADPAASARDITGMADLPVSAIETTPRAYTAVIRNARVGYAAPLVDRSLAVLHRDAPPEANELSLRFEQRGATLGEVRVDRDTWARSKTELLPESQRPARPQVTAVRNEAAPSPQTPRYAPPAKPYSYGFALNYRQSLGGPDSFVLYQVAAEATGEWRPRDDTWLTGTWRLGLLDNYDKFKSAGSSNLPRVRTLVREYVTSSRSTIPNLQLTHLAQWRQDHFFMAYGGLLENMFAGAGGEYLYRPTGSAFAVGADINRVRQRDFDQKFKLRDYTVDTGHLSVYWDLRKAGLVASASVGQYLAGDRGVTVNLSRMFANGVSIGAYATKTNVSAQQFGEGSFDKGLYVQIPFDAILPRSGPSSATIVYAPLLRDGGAKLARYYTLYGQTRMRDPRVMGP